MSNDIWDDAPDWAMWIQTDEDGSRWWHEFKPKIDGRYWRSPGHEREFDGKGDPATWRESLQERPDSHRLDKMRARVAELEAKLAAFAEVTAELADDLEAEVKAHYVHDGKIHPAVEKKYWRDMRPVQAARALLAKEITQ